MRILVIAAHPDDEVLGCGATLPQLVKKGHEAYILILGEGVTSRFSEREKVDQVLLSQLRECSLDVARILGAKDVYFHNLPDNRFDTIPLLDIVKIVEKTISDISPEVVYTHHAGDLNIDHQIVHRAVLTATRPFKGQPVREVYSFEIPSSTEWAFQRIEPVFRPNVFVDISETLKIKIDALSRYEGEVRKFPHPRSPEAIQAIAHRWGSVVGCETVEAFELIRAIR